MKLAALGAITAVIGAGMQIPGLIGIGLFWVVLGPVMRRYGQRVVAMRDAAGTASIDGRTFAVGSLLWGLLGIPSLLVGVLRLGIDADDAAWRWLPIAVGVLAVGIGGVAAVLYLLGAAAPGSGGTPTAPANLWIRATRETGTFINERPRLELDLQVEPDPATGLAPYAVTKKATVPFTALAHLRVGEGFRALVVGPDDPTTMEIHWAEPLSAPEGASD